MNNKSLRQITLTVILISFYLLSSGQKNVLVVPEKPKLIVVLSVSQFRNDYISRYWDKLSENGLKRMIERGTYCKNTSYNYLINDKGVGTATLVTGANPSLHGIIADSWYSDLKGTVIKAVDDETINTIGGSFDQGRYSPQHLLSTTFSDEINLSNHFNSRIISVSLEPISAVVSAGHTAQASYWFDNQQGNFITSSYYIDSLPAWVNEFNSKKFADIYLEQTWNTLLPIEQYTESMSDSNPYEEGFNGNKVFPYEISDLTKNLKKNERFGILNSVPYGNTMVKDFAIQVLANENLGMDDFTDVLCVNFTAHEQIGRLFGPLSIEMQDAVLRLDSEIAHFISFIESTVGIENTLFIFSAEHGLPYNPEYLTDHKIPAGYFNSASAISLLKSYLNNLYGKGEWIKEYHAQQIYLNRTLIESAGLNLSQVQDNVAGLLLQFHGVENTLTSYSLQNTNFSSGVFLKIQNGYNQKRSGDVIFSLKNGWIEKEGRNIVSYGHDAHIPLIWYGWKMKRKTVLQPVDLTDVAPTISVLLDISFPNSSTGIPIEDVVR
ncbi:MAG: alkaline phosphatase family protein [Bacteroidota bacterium]|nr:MAG: alkaline phosphatase family protein [Bacteroidota bacterium]